MTNEASKLITNVLNYMSTFCGIVLSEETTTEAATLLGYIQDLQRVDFTALENALSKPIETASDIQAVSDVVSKLATMAFPKLSNDQATSIAAPLMLALRTYSILHKPDSADKSEDKSCH